MKYFSKTPGVCPGKYVYCWSPMGKTPGGHETPGGHDYIHHNPVRGKWQLVNDFTEYEHSSASFYEKGIKKYEGLVYINEVLL